MRISKYNHEGYPDPTTHDALVNIEKEKRAARLAALPRSPTFRPIVFICSPYADDPLNNERRAIRYCRFAVRQGYIPIAHTSISHDFWTNAIPPTGSWGYSWDGSC